ncbi:MAG TPA: hypothetical protein VGZ50_03470, partial [Actinomycetota bacterium]|nr:hypothetical protein [Actinomycetota bacterium]
MDEQDRGHEFITSRARNGRHSTRHSTGHSTGHPARHSTGHSTGPQLTMVAMHPRPQKAPASTAMSAPAPNVVNAQQARDNAVRTAALLVGPQRPGAPLDACALIRAAYGSGGIKVP